MSEKSINTLHTEAIIWLSDMGCDEPTDDIQRNYYGLRSKVKVDKILTNDQSNSELKINTLNIEHIDNISDLFKYISLNPLINNIK